MKRIIRSSLPFAASALVALALPACAQPGPPAATFTVKIVGFNDYHGTLQSPGSFGVNLSVPVAQRPAVGGAEYLAAYVARLKAQNPLNVVVGAGDFIGASPLISALFFDEPAIETLNKIGIEFNLLPAVERARMGCDAAGWQGATTLRAHAREEEQRGQRAATRLSRVRSALTQEVKVPVGQTSVVAG